MRDVFDLAVVIAHLGDGLVPVLDDLEEKLPRLIDRVSKLKPGFAEKAAGDINLTEQGRQYLEQAPDIVLAFLEERRNRHRQRPK